MVSHTNRGEDDGALPADRLLDACPHCAAAWAAGPQTPQQVYDRIELPAIKPEVPRVRLFGGRCACCGERAVATAPAGFEPGSPFGKSIEAITVYLHYAQSIGLERLRLVFGELFGLSISEGALCSILARAQAPLQAAGSAILALVTTSDVVASTRPRYGDEEDLLGMGVRDRRQERLVS